MTRLIETPLGNLDVYLDIFVIMEKGERALSQFTNCVRNPRYAGDQKVKKQLQEKLTIYHFYPPLDYLGRKKESPKLFYEVEEIGGIAEEEFMKRGPAIILDDVVSSGKTLGESVQFLCSLGYGFDEMFVETRRHFPEERDGKGILLPYSFEHITSYAELLTGILPLDLESVRLVGLEHS